MSRLVALVAGLSILGIAGCPKSSPPAKEPVANQPAPKEPEAEAPPAEPAKPPEPEEPTVATPKDVAAPPADAERTPSGLATKVLTPGKGNVRPRFQDEVVVHYSGWTTDGKMFDSSVLRGQPLSFPVRGVIVGFSEGVQLMVVGEKRRMWIPKELAYDDRPNMPAGMLVFDVELLEIIPGPDPLPAPADVGAAPKDAKKDKTGLAWKITKKGKGKHPKATDYARFHFTVWRSDGMMLETTTRDPHPTSQAIDQAIPVWKTILPMMSVGEKRLVWTPVEQSFEHMPGTKAGDMVVFELELVSFVTPPAVPKDVAAAPADAEVTASGLASKVLKKGKGKVHPTAESTVKVNYSGWTTDGKMFDSSITRGTPAIFKLANVIAGWTEGVQLMVEGETRRFWIPVDLAYRGKEGRPAGMLVFDVELLAIDPPAE